MTAFFACNNLALMGSSNSFANCSYLVVKSLSLATMAQFRNGLMDRRFGVPVIFGIINNQYSMSGQLVGEVSGVDYLARRGAGYDTDAMHAEVVDGMDVLAVLDATRRAAEVCRRGHGPALLEFVTYRFKGHSLHDPLTYRDSEELCAWQERDPIGVLTRKLLEADFPEDQGGPVTEDEIDELSRRVWQRNADMAARTREAAAPEPATLLDHLYSSTTAEVVPPQWSKPSLKAERPVFKRDAEGKLNYRFALREALIEEMARDGRIVILGEDIAEYGGAFGVTADLLKLFGRERIFNTSISESAIVGAGVGMAMTGLRPVAEIMYCDFILQAMDQLGNQAAKWTCMSGGQVTIPLVVRTAIGGGRGYAGQHSQSLESVVTHIPGLIAVAPSNAYDAKGLLKSAIRDDNPVVFFEHQLLYNAKDVVPEEQYLVPIGKARVAREGTDVTVVAWSRMVEEALAAAARLEGEGLSVEVVDVRTLVPLDEQTLAASARKTGRVVVTAQACDQGSFTGNVANRIQTLAFDYLDAPVITLGAANGVSPTAQSLEKAFLPDAEKLIAAIRTLY